MFEALSVTYFHYHLTNKMKFSRFAGGNLLMADSPDPLSRLPRGLFTSTGEESPNPAEQTNKLLYYHTS